MKTYKDTIQCQTQPECSNLVQNTSCFIERNNGTRNNVQCHTWNKMSQIVTPFLMHVAHTSLKDTLGGSCSRKVLLAFSRFKMTLTLLTMFMERSGTSCHSVLNMVSNKVVAIKQIGVIDSKKKVYCQPYVITCLFGIDSSTLDFHKYPISPTTWAMRFTISPFFPCPGLV